MIKTKSNHLRAWLEHSGMSQRELAGRAKMDHTLVSRMMNNQRGVRLDDLDALADALKVDPWMLVLTPELATEIVDSFQRAHLLDIYHHPDEVEALNKELEAVKAELAALKAQSATKPWLTRAAAPAPEPGVEVTVKTATGTIVTFKAANAKDVAGVIREIEGRTIAMAA